MNLVSDTNKTPLKNSFQHNFQNYEIQNMKKNIISNIKKAKGSIPKTLNKNRSDIILPAKFSEDTPTTQMNSVFNDFSPLSFYDNSPLFVENNQYTKKNAFKKDFRSKDVKDSKNTSIRDRDINDAQRKQVFNTPTMIVNNRKDSLGIVNKNNSSYCLMDKTTTNNNTNKVYKQLGNFIPSNNKNNNNCNNISNSNYNNNNNKYPLTRITKKNSSVNFNSPEKNIQNNPYLNCNNYINSQQNQGNKKIGHIKHISMDISSTIQSPEQNLELDIKIEQFSNVKFGNNQYIKSSNPQSSLTPTYNPTNNILLKVKQKKNPNTSKSHSRNISFAEET